MAIEKERNRQIYEAYLNGDKYSDLAQKYSLTISRIKEICKREKKRGVCQENALYQLLMEVCEDEIFVGRTFTVLERIGVTTIEEMLKLDRNTLRKTRNCGKLMQALILKARERGK